MFDCTVNLKRAKSKHDAVDSFWKARILPWWAVKAWNGIQSVNTFVLPGEHL